MTNTTASASQTVGASFIPDHRTEWEPTGRWIRVRLGDQWVADSKRAMMLRETGRLPVYYFPEADVRMDLLTPGKNTNGSPVLGEATRYTVKAGDKVAEDAAWTYANPSAGAPSVKGYMAFEWKKMDAWYEEDDEVFVHPRDPYKRIDVMHSSRHVQIVLGGEVVADTKRPRLLFETNLPTRYYIPKQDVRMDLLIPSDKSTRCPYKGVASYYSVKVGDKVFENIVWYYPYPIPECPKIENLLCFYNEHVDSIIVDGEPQERPVTTFS